MIRRPAPETLLAVVVGAIFANQLLFTVYVLAVHDGDPGFVSRYLPSGWFELWIPGWLADVAARWPWPGALAPSVLHVQAFWELPFVLLAYLVAVRWLDDETYRRLATTWRLWAASVVWTAVFCGIELLLANPWTVGDLGVRLASAVITPWLVSRCARAAAPLELRRPTARGQLLFGLSLGLLGYLVLVIYDTALLYNLGRLPRQLPWAVAALLLLILTRALAEGLVNHGATTGGNSSAAHRPVMTLLEAWLRHALILFFVPALAVRYVMSYFGGLVAGVAMVLLIALAAAVMGTRESMPGRPRRTQATVLALAVLALGVGCAAGLTVARCVPAAYVETTLGLGAAAMFMTSVTSARIVESWIPTDPLSVADAPRPDHAKHAPWS